MADTWDANGDPSASLTPRPPLCGGGAPGGAGFAERRGNTYTCDTANRLISATQGANTYGFAHDGLGDRLRQTVNGVPTTYTLDLNAGLTQVLADGSNTYLYGAGRLAQQSAARTDYFLGDALGSAR